LEDVSYSSLPRIISNIFLM